MGKKNATREQKRAFLLELRCQWLENGKSLDKVSVKRLRHLYKVGTVPKEQLSMLLEKGAVTDQIIDEFEAMVTEYFRNGNERRKTLKENTKPTNPMDYPTAPLPSDYGGNLMQTAIDFDKERIADNIGQLILEVRRVAEALEILAGCVTDPVYNSPYINIRQQP